LRDGDRITLGTSCQVRFHQPNAVSATARLEIASGHRLPLSVDGVLLMAETCIIGPAAGSHLVIPELTRPVVLTRRKEGLSVHAVGEITIDGQKLKDRGNLTLRSTVAADDFRLSIEPVGANLGR
jgi:hypothetical protein